MFDIDFYMKAAELKKKLMSGARIPGTTVFREFERCRGRDPVVFNLETTNACNMRCTMCPRTTRMTRKVETMDMRLFRRIGRQLFPHPAEKWARWEVFVREHYGVGRGEMSENHFFLYVIPRVITLHGYGEPLLDGSMAERVKFLSRRGVPTYFSCNPANIDIDKSIEIFDSGLDYVKYTVESVDDRRQKQIRGPVSDFSGSYRKIMKLLELKKARGFKTTIVITMIDRNERGQTAEYGRLKAAFKGADVYLYLKSMDQKWHQNVQYPTRSIHWREFCQFPWSSMTIASNGAAVMCVTDYNNEIVVGQARSQSLRDIWNGKTYRAFRKKQLSTLSGIKCTDRCDMWLPGRASTRAVNGGRA